MNYLIESKDFNFEVKVINGFVDDCPANVAFLMGMTLNALNNVVMERQWRIYGMETGVKPMVPHSPRGSSEGETLSPSIHHPVHYNLHPSGVECLTVVRHMNFNLGNAIKYIWRCGLKDNTTDIEDLKKAVFYLQDEIERLEG